MVGDDLDAAALAVRGGPEPALGRSCDPHATPGREIVIQELIGWLPNGDRQHVHPATRLVGAYRDEQAHQCCAAGEGPDLGGGGEASRDDDQIEVHGSPFDGECGTPRRYEPPVTDRLEPMSRVTQLADDLYMIDALMFDDTERLACYVFDGPERVLIECGPSVTLHHLTDALEQAGLDGFATIAVTHIHLDHAGGIGHLASRYPDARIGVHAAGARHLVDPTRLWDSATRVYGEDGMMTLWGPLEPVPEDRLLILDEGSTIALGGGRSLEVMYTPGHARHHIVFHDDATGAMLVGDSVGIAFPHGHIVQPVTPPPDLHPPTLVEQLRRMAAREPAFLGFAHYGPHHEPAQALQEAERRLDDWVSLARKLRTDPQSAPDRLRTWVLDGYRNEGIPDDVIATYDKNTYWPMMPAGIFRWLDATE